MRPRQLRKLEPPTQIAGRKLEGRMLALSNTSITTELIKGEAAAEHWQHNHQLRIRKLAASARSDESKIS